MTTRRSSLFCDTALAARIERVETEFIVTAAEAGRSRRADGTGFAIPVAGGAAVFAEDDSPLNKVVGLGFAGMPGAAALDEVERAYATCGAPTQVELAHLADPDIAAALTDRGYRLDAFEDVLGRALAEAPRPATVLHDEEIAGGAGLRISEGIAQFAGAATAPGIPAPGHPVPHCWQPGSPTPSPRAATSPSSRPTRIHLGTEGPPQRLQPAPHPRRTGQEASRHLIGVASGRPPSVRASSSLETRCEALGDLRSSG